MTRYVCSSCGYVSESERDVAGHIKRNHDDGSSASTADRYGNTVQCYEYRATIMEYEPEEKRSLFDRLRAMIERLIGRDGR